MTRVRKKADYKYCEDGLVCVRGKKKKKGGFSAA